MPELKNMTYKIQPYSFNKAKELGVIIRVSTVKGKKIDVWKNNDYVCSIGDLSYGDYPTFIKWYGLKTAEVRRKLYKQRHEHDRHEVGSAGWYADQLLW